MSKFGLFILITSVGKPFLQIIFRYETFPNFPASWKCGDDLKKSVDIINSTYLVPNLKIECVIEVRRCQIEGESPSCSKSPIENCIIATRIKKCLKQFPVKKNCTGNDDRQFQSKLINIYEDIYRELKCVLTIGCSKIGTGCWDRALHNLNTAHNIRSLPLKFMEMVDFFNMDSYDSQFSEMRIEKFIRKTMCW